MSTHSLDASGARTLTTTTNDPARTAATVSAKAGDDVITYYGAMDFVEILIPEVAGACELVRYKRATRVAKRDDAGEFVRDDDRQIVYEDGVVEQTVLRIRYGLTIVGRTGTDPEKVSNTPHTTQRIVNLDNDSNKPQYLLGEVVSEVKIDLGYGTEKEAA